MFSVKQLCFLQMCNVHIILETVYSGLSKSNIKDHYDDATT